ncbi:MAG: acyloxyacyl hydrolase [Bacteroidaceae bacterium]|nr:acyloxyacyl hydrolase [Bacteroidaceae bacterium]
MDKTRILTLAFCLLAGAFRVSAQKIDKEHLSIGFRGRYSHILDGHNIYSDLIDSHNYAIFDATVGLTTRPEDGGWYERAFNYPTFGIGLSYARMGTLDFKDASRLGDIVNLYTWAEFNLIRTKHFRAGPLLELGLAFTGQTYDYYQNPKNRFIGSKVLAVFGTGLQAEWLFSPHWALQAGLYLTHHSNGMTRSPNLGINELSVGMGVRHYLASTSFSAKPKDAPEKPEYLKGIHWNVFAAGGVHSCPVELDGILVSDNPARLAPARFHGVTGLEAVWRYTPIFGTGIGLQADYVPNNYRETDLLLTGKEDPDGYSPFRLALYLKQEFWYRRLSVHIAGGVYLFKRCGLTEDITSTFEKIGLRYHFRQQGGLFAGLDLRAHQFDRSYALEWSLGYSF